MPEAKPRDTNHTVGIIAIWYFDKEHILIAQSVAEACYLEIKHIFILQNVQKVSNVGIIHFGVFELKARPRDTKHTMGLISIWYFDNKHILTAQSEAEDI